MVGGVGVLVGVEGTRMGQGRGRTVAAEGTLWKELELVMVSVAGDRAGSADATRCRAGYTEIDGLADVTQAKSAAVKLVGNCEGSLF